jgi:hypothetical protein
VVPVHNDWIAEHARYHEGRREVVEGDVRNLQQCAVREVAYVTHLPEEEVKDSISTVSANEELEHPRER